MECINTTGTIDIVSANFNRLVIWADKWGMSLNILRTKIMAFSLILHKTYRKYTRRVFINFDCKFDVHIHKKIIN